MLKSCPSCSYIGNDGEHICPFCKSDLAVGWPRQAVAKLHPTNRVRMTVGRIARNGSRLPVSSRCYRADGFGSRDTVSTNALLGLQEAHFSLNF